MYKQVVIDGIDTNYNIFNNGDCFNTKTSKFLSGSIKNNGYKMYNLTINGKKKDFLAHRLVALHFIPNPNNYPVVNHKDGNKLNNNVNNLEWISHAENRQHSYDNDLCNKRGKQKKYEKDLFGEEWKQFLDTTYYISNLGRIKNIKNNNLLEGSLNKEGYKRCTLRVNNKSKSFLIHKLVYFTFNNIEEKDGYVINHKDGNKINNKLENLEYISNSENVLHGKYKLNSEKGKKICYKMDDNKNIITNYSSLTNAAKDINGSIAGISLAIKNNNKYMGYYWK